MTTYAELVTQIRDYTETDDQVLTTTIVNDFIEHAEHRIFRDVELNNDNFSFTPNDTLNKFLTDNCNPGTTTVFIDMDGVLTEYYQAVATYATNNGLLDSGGDWYNLTPTIEGQAIVAAGASYFSGLGKRAEANALVDLVIAKNGSYRILTTDTVFSSYNT